MKLKNRCLLLSTLLVCCLSSSAFAGQILIQGTPGRDFSQLNSVNQQVLSSPSPTSYKDRAAVYQQLGLKKEAIDDLNQALALEPKDAVALLLKGEVYFASGMYPEAAKSCDDAIKIDPKFVGAYTLRISSFIKEKQYAKALADLDTLFTLSPNSAVPYALRGAAYVGMGKYDNAIKDCTEAITRDPKQAKAFYYRAEAYQDSGQYDKSIPDFTEAINLEPSFRPALLGRAWSEQKMGKDEDAITDCSRAIRFDSADMLRAVNKFVGEKTTVADITPDPEYNWGLQIEDELKSAITLYDDVLKDKPGDPDTLRDRGLAYMHLSKYREAVRDFEAANKAMPLNPPDFPGFGSQDAYNAAKVDYQQGNQNLTSGNYQAALDNYRNAIQKYPQYARAWHNMAITCGGLGDFFSAELCCVHAISYRPDDWKLWNTFGYVLFHEYQNDKSDPALLSAADYALRQSLALKPDSENDKEQVRQLLGSVKSYQRSLAPASNFVITTMPVI
jgi:tetratricopeptide (TPR) repeat protein